MALTQEELGQVQLFASLSAEEREQVAALCRPRIFTAGDWCFQQNEPLGDLHILRRGRVALVFPLPPAQEGRLLTIQTVEPGQVFGWSALVPPHQATLSARCVDEGEVCLLARQDLFALFDRRKEIGYRVMQELAGLIGGRVRQLEQQLVLELASTILAGNY